MFKSIFRLALIACTLVVPAVHANLITNGSFEDNNVSQNTWQWFTADNVNGWSGSNIEIWDQFHGVSAVDGSQFAELNAHANSGQQFSIFQTFETEANGLYNLSFYYQARQSESERFEVAVTADSGSIFEQVMDDHVRNHWSMFTSQFMAVSDKTTLIFTSLTPYSGTIGNFIDAISVTAVTNSFTPQASVNEPGTLAIAILGLSALLFMRFRRKHD